MNPFTIAKFVGPIIAGGLLIWAVVAHFSNDDKTRKALETLRHEAGATLAATRKASGNRDLPWNLAPGQITAMGETINLLHDRVEVQNRAIDDMAAEAVRLRAKAAELKKIADKAEAQRSAALRRLSDMAITPGTRDDCMTLLSEAEDALDLVREAGK